MSSLARYHHQQDNVITAQLITSDSVITARLITVKLITAKLMAIAIALLLPAHTVLAQAFPGKLVRVIIPFPTGSSTDAQARIL